MSDWEVASEKPAAASGGGDWAVVSEKPSGGIGSSIMAAAAPTIRGAGPYAAGAAVGAGLGALFGGVGAIPGAVAGAGAVGALDLGAAIYNPIAGVTGLPHFAGPSESFGQAMTKSGLQESATPSARIAQAMASGIGGAASIPKAADQLAKSMAPGVAKNVAEQFAAGTGSQLIAGAASSLASQSTAEMGGGPVAQLLAGLGGGVATQAPGMMRQAAMRRLQGGGANIPNIKANIKTFEDAGSTATAGQATQTRIGQAGESVLSKIPGGAGVLEKKVTEQAEQIGAKAESIAARISQGRGISAENAGNVIEKGLVKEGGWRDSFVAGGEKLFDKLDKWLPHDKMVGAPNIRGTLAELNADIPNAEALSQLFKKQEIVAIERFIQQDAEANAARGGVMVKPMTGGYKMPEQTPTANIPSTEMPYLAIKKLRTLAGREMADITSSATLRDKWKSVYAAASRDMEGAATSAGPDAEKAFHRGNKYWKAGMDRMEQHIDAIVKSGIPSEIYYSATADVRHGSERISAVLRSLKGNPEAQNIVRAKFINDLGIAAPGNQTALGDKFSTQTFLTNWSKVHPKAKAVLFAGENGQVRESLDAIAKAAENIRTGSRAFANPSGTAQATAAIHQTRVAEGALIFLLTGHPILAAGTIAGPASVALVANRSAHLMADPVFVKGLARAIKAPPGRQAAIMQGAIAGMADSENRKAAMELIR